MKKRQSSSRNQSSSPTSESSLSPSASPSPELHHHHHHHHHHDHSHHQQENIPYNCSKSSSDEIPDNSPSDDSGDPQPSTIAEADRVEKMQLAKLQDKKTRIRYDPPSQCPCCGRISRGSRHIA